MRSVHEYTAEFMRLAERNDLRESEGQQVASYIEGLKPQSRDMIGMQVMQDLYEAKNMTLKAEFMMQDRRRIESSRRNYGNDISGAPIDDGLKVQERQPLKDRFREEKTARKQNVMDNKETPKTTNPYTRPALLKCFKCNLPDHKSSDCPLRKLVHLVEREEEEVTCTMPKYTFHVAIFHVGHVSSPT